MDEKLSEKIKKFHERRDARLSAKRVDLDGGEGSGNWGHAGRPGEIGGSKKGGGVHNRYETEEGSTSAFKHGTYTSWAKERNDLSIPHRETSKSLSSHYEGSVVIEKTDSATYRWKKNSDGEWENLDTGEVESSKEMSKHDRDFRVAVPDEKNPNFSIIDNPDYMDDKRRADAKVYKDKKSADAVFRPKVRKIFEKFTDGQKKAIEEYTGDSYEDLNERLRDGHFGEGDSPVEKQKDKMIDDITEAISQSTLDNDTVLFRQISPKTFKAMFGADFDSLDTKKGRDMIVGREGTDDGFMSCGTSEGTGWASGHHNIHLEIVCPKGTEALYVEPFACMGGGKSGAKWDLSDSSYISGEQETMLQRGTTLKIIGIEAGPGTYSGGAYNVKVQVVGQGREGFRGISTKAKTKNLRI